MQIRRQVPLQAHTTLKLGGPASFFVSVTSSAELAEALVWAETNGMAHVILGGGSNILFPDEGFEGLVIRIAIPGMRYERRGAHVYVTAGAGEDWDRLVLDTVSKNLWGLENLSLIPGSVGATPVQNVGAYGVEVSDRIEWFDVLNIKTKKIERLSAEDARFSYRESLLKTGGGKHLIVVEVCFRLRTDPSPVLSYRDVAEYFKVRSEEPSLREIREAVIAIRRRKFPDVEDFGTAGSFFKNPIISSVEARELRARFQGLPVFELPEGRAKLSLAWVLDHVLNLKGVWFGNVGVFKGQPLVLMNNGKASSEDMLSLVHFVEKRVHDTLGIDIVPEVQIIETQNRMSG